MDPFRPFDQPFTLTADNYIEIGPYSYGEATLGSIIFSQKQNLKGLYGETLRNAMTREITDTSNQAYIKNSDLEIHLFVKKNKIFAEELVASYKNSSQQKYVAWVSGPPINFQAKKMSKELSKNGSVFFILIHKSSLEVPSPPIFQQESHRSRILKIRALMKSQEEHHQPPSSTLNQPIQNDSLTYARTRKATFEGKTVNDRMKEMQNQRQNQTESGIHKQLSQKVHAQESPSNSPTQTQNSEPTFGTDEWILSILK